MRPELRRSILLLTVLLAPWPVQSAGLAAEKAADTTVKQCAATTPVPNPWTKGNPSGWWLKRHEAILASLVRKEARIAFIGDSITDGWDAEGSGLKVWEKEYVPLGALNLGINCDCTQHVLWRLDHGEVDGLPKLKVVVVMIGTNNAGLNRHEPEDIAAGIEAICGRLKQKVPQAKILLLGIFPKGHGQDTVDKTNDMIAKLDDGKQIFYQNINDALRKSQGAIADRVGHLTEKGFEVWAEQIRPTLKKLMQ